jgi:DNA-directed RNA polymerase III subunit RPC3
MQIPDDVNLADGLVYPKKASTNTCIKDYLSLMASADNPTPAGRAATFVSYDSSKVQVEFDIIARRMRKRVLEAVTREKHGSGGVRIVRLLMQTGKMDEKQVIVVIITFAPPYL